MTRFIIAACLALSSTACVKETFFPTITVYGCAARQAQILMMLNQTQPTLPTILHLPSGERVYVQDNGLIYHYDGPVCQE